MSLPSSEILPAEDQRGTPADKNGRADSQSSLPTEMPAEQWQQLRRRMLSRAESSSAESVFGEAARNGDVYRWGLAAAIGGPCEQRVEVLSRIACGRAPRKRIKAVDLAGGVEELVERLGGNDSNTPLVAATALVWAAALPKLSELLEQEPWWSLLSSLQQYRESVLQRAHADAPTHLLAAEIGLTLSWRLKDLPSCKRLEKPSADALTDWCKREEEAIGGAVAGATTSRLLLACLMRCRELLEKTTKRRFKKQLHRVGDDLATWVAAMTSHTGQTAFSPASRKDLAADLGKHGLLHELISFDPEALRPSIDAALGETQTGGRLAWQVCLPEAFHHDEDAKLAIMFPDWDVRRGRVHFDYSQADNRIELFAGRAKILGGDCQTMIALDGDEQEPCGDWTTSCDYTDDDVHYLEIEQPWSGGVTLQRQVMLVREDRCVLLADSVVPNERPADPARQIRYDTRFPLANAVKAEPEAETREVIVSESGHRGLIIPLSACEWRVGPSNASLKVTDDQHLHLSAQGTGSLYAPLWCDFQQRRLRRKRTWRQLTVADELRIVGHHEAVGFRIQMGSEQWLVYRSLAESRPRSVLGKHLVADFFSARFDMSDGNLEELVTVDDHDDD